MKLTRLLFSSLIMVLLLTLAACGSSSTTSSSGYTTTATTTPTAGTTPTSTPVAGTTATTLHTTSATLSGKTMTLLTNAQGMTLYYFKPDTATKVACTGGCASTWPPLFATGSSVPKSTTTLPGKLVVQANANGKQVVYNGHPLYTYAGDTAPGQTNGEGIGNNWFVATTNLAMNGGSTPTNGGY